MADDPAPDDAAGEGRRGRLSVPVRRLLGSGKRRPAKGVPVRRPIFYSDIVIADGSELERGLLSQGFAPEEVMLKYCWPKYAPPATAGIRSISKSENLGLQFERLIAMHRVTPAHIPMPAARVMSAEGDFAGYILEYVSGETLQTLISHGLTEEARGQLALVEATIERLHAKSLPHGDVNPSNVIVADDGRTLLIDPVANPGFGAKLQDQLCLAQIRDAIEGTRNRLTG
ncbi:MAG TPA: hypothetical protein VG265_06400 [Gaiellaceae bacterium]|nr:hypothetical protein [Gaiellaceae bacterium]